MPEPTKEQVALTLATLNVAQYVSCFRDEILNALETSTTDGGYGDIAAELRKLFDQWQAASEDLLRSLHTGG